MKQEHRKAVAGFKLSILDQLKAREFHPSVNAYMILWLIGQVEELDQKLEFAQGRIEGSKGDNMEDKIYKITLENYSEKLVKAQFYRKDNDGGLDLLVETKEEGRVEVSSFAVGQWRYIEMVTGEIICDETETAINEVVTKISEIYDIAIRRILDKHNTEPESGEMNIKEADPETYTVQAEPRIEFRTK